MKVLTANDEYLVIYERCFGMDSPIKVTDFDPVFYPQFIQPFFKGVQGHNYFRYLQKGPGLMSTRTRAPFSAASNSDDIYSGEMSNVQTSNKMFKLQIISRAKLT